MSMNKPTPDNSRLVQKYPLGTRLQSEECLTLDVRAPSKPSRSDLNTELEMGSSWWRQIRKTVREFAAQYDLGTEAYRIGIGFCLFETGLSRIWTAGEFSELVRSGDYFRAQSGTFVRIFEAIFSQSAGALFFEITFLTLTLLLLLRRSVFICTLLLLTFQIGLMKVMQPFVQGTEAILLYWLFPLLLIYFPVGYWQGPPQGFPFAEAFRVLGLFVVRGQLMVVYFSAGLAKVLDSDWNSGNALLYTVQMKYESIVDLSAILAFPWILRFSCYAIILFELSFPFLIWVRRFQPFLFLLGLFFHLSTAVLLDIPAISLGCLISYFAFCTNDQMSSWREGMGRLRRRFFKGPTPNQITRSTNSIS